MSKQKKPKTWAEEIADLDNPAPRDLDPEQPDEEDSSEASGKDDAAEAREHYVDVGKSKLRKPGAITLGPEYSGSHISRDNLFELAEVSDDDPFASAQSQQDSLSGSSESGEYADPDNVDLDMDQHTGQDEEIDSNEAFGPGDEEKFEGYTFRGGRKNQEGSSERAQMIGEAEGSEIHENDPGFGDMETDEMDTTKNLNGVNENGASSAGTPSGSEVNIDDAEDIAMGVHGSLSSESEGSQSETSSSDTDEDSSSAPADDDRAILRKMMAESQKVITSNLSKAAKSDIAKGRAIKQQRTAFDSLLNTRIRLQKALIATNSLQTPTSSNIPADPAVAAAEQATLKLWTTLDSLRQSIHPVPSPPKPPLEPSSTTPLSTLWTRMQSHESQVRPRRISTLNKWSSKTAPASSLPRTNKFSSTPTQQPLSAVLDHQLTSTTNMEKLIAKTRVPRSCAPVQATTTVSSTSPPEETTTILPIYDDSDFYSLLLRDLLSSRSSSDPFPSSLTAPPTIPGIKDPNTRVKKKVDTKA
ncbi:MAG: hypothetical protein Q9225_005059, partial [Loekoesia sp. 1 TL-2023]